MERDYKKLYEEALKRAKELRRQVNANETILVNSDLDTIFPELRESEGERIRKEIVDYLRKFIPHHDCDLVAKSKVWIAWLEKQSEKESIEQDTEIRDLWEYIGEWRDKFGRLPKDEDELADCIYYVMKRQKPADKVEQESTWNEKIKGLNELETYILSLVPDRSLDAIKVDAKNIRYIINKEHKPANKIEQSCYHNDGLYYAIDILEKTLGKVEGYQSDDGKMEHQIAIETVNALYHKKPTWSEEDEGRISWLIKYLSQGEGLYDNLIDWLKSLKYRVQPQPKREWSEEDESYLNVAINNCQEYGNNYIADFLRSLKNRVQPQPKQEWSEEDEYQINTILHGLDLKREHYKKEGNQVEEKRYKTQYDWLKSLKPQSSLYDKGYNDGFLLQKYNNWKPSEEQMKTLWNVICYVEDDINSNFVGGCMLESLYNDLKKL